MDDKTIEMVLKKIIEIDKKTNESHEKMSSEIELREIELKDILNKRKKELETITEQEGKKVYDDLMKNALVQKESIINECNVQLQELDKLLEANKDVLKEKVFKKLSLI